MNTPLSAQTSLVDKLTSQGADSLTNSELVFFLLSKEDQTDPLFQELLANQSWKEVFTDSPEKLAEMFHIDISRAQTIVTAFTLAKRIYAQRRYISDFLEHQALKVASFLAYKKDSSHFVIEVETNQAVGA
jgi:DNA repair protein RadC